MVDQAYAFSKALALVKLSTLILSFQMRVVVVLFRPLHSTTRVFLERQRVEEKGWEMVVVVVVVVVVIAAFVVVVVVGSSKFVKWMYDIRE